jgi:SAM-dependent methyltransferase
VSDDTPPFQELLAEATRLGSCEPKPSIAELVLRLKRAFPTAPSETIALIAETVQTRDIAARKLGDWSRDGLFTKALLEQASRTPIAQHRAAFFTGRSHVLEVGTGTGSDTAALARVCAQVTTVEADPERLELARHNLQVQNISNVTFLQGEATEIVPLLDPSQFDALFADPARRTKDGTRIKSAESYSPPLEWLLSLSIGDVRAIKVSPGLFIDAQDRGWSRQFVGYGDECLEQTLWFGANVPDSSAHLADARATWSPNTQAATLPAVTESFEGFIIEPHGVINRSQYAHLFFAEHCIVMIDPQVTYGITATEPSISPWYSSFRILEGFPFHIKTLKNALTTLAWTNRTEIKKRNYQGSPEAIREKLKLPAHTHGAPFGTIFVFTRDSTTWAILAERLTE